MEGSGEVLVPISWGIYSAGLTISRANYTLYNYIDQLQDSISQQVPSVKYKHVYGNKMFHSPFFKQWKLKNELWLVFEW